MAAGGGRMTDKDTIDYCKNCDVEPPAMRFKCPECEHNPDNENNLAKDINVPHKEQIIVDTDKYFVELTDESRGTIGYTVVFPGNLLKDIIKQNKQLAHKTQECEELISEKDFYLQKIETLEDKCENLLNEYDELLQNTPDCKNCENNIMQTLAEAEIKLDRLERYYDLLNKALDIKEELNKTLREENQELKNKLRILENDR